MQIYLPIAEMAIEMETIFILSAFVGFLSGIFDFYFRLIVIFFRLVIIITL